MNEKKEGMVNEESAAADARSRRLLRWLALPAAATAVWLIWQSDPGLLVGQWPLWLALAALAAGAARLEMMDLSDLQGVGSSSRFVTWSAALALGPTALWLDPVSLLADGLWRRRGGQRWQVREAGLRLALILVRDTLPGLAALSVYRLLNGRFLANPLPPGFVNETLPPLLAAVGVHVGVFLLLGLVVTAVDEAGRAVSWLERAPRMLQLGTAVLFVFLLPQPLAATAALFFGLGGAWAFFIFWVCVGLVGALAHARQQEARGQRRLTAKLAQLEKLALAIMQEPAEAVDLSPLLTRYAPLVFGESWLEVRLLPDSVLYAQGSGWAPAPDGVWEELAQVSDDYLLLPAMPEAADAGGGHVALLLPLWNRQNELMGGVYLVPPAAQPVDEWITPAHLFAAQIAAGLNRIAQFEEALASQAAAYEQEVYAQAYQAEVYAQALAYERMSQELSVAGRIQSSFLPQSLPDLNGWQVAVALEPALETSGDFYDFIPLPNGRWGLLVADVADKGMGAALYMALSRTLIRIYAAEHDTAPEKALAAANQRILSDTNSDLFVTVFYGILDPETGLLTYCNAGHNPPLLCAGNGGPDRKLTRTAMPVGLFADMPWGCESVQMAPGDVLVVYTDGVVEAEDETADYFGEERLHALTRSFLSRPADVIEDKIVTAVYDFMGDADQHDDITLMVVTRDNDT